MLVTTKQVGRYSNKYTVRRANLHAYAIQLMRVTNGTQ